MDVNSLHLYMELMAVTCLFFISAINFLHNATGQYSKLMGIGTGIAGITDLTHALIPIFYPDIAEHWMLMSWGASRVTLIFMFLMVYLCYDIIRCQMKNLAVILATPLIFVTFMAASSMMDIGSFHLWPHSMVVFGTLVYHPLDFVLLLSWLLVAVILRKKAHILFPPHVYWLFMSQGIMVHAIMSFTASTSMDMPSLLAHALKISEYYSFILIYLLYDNAAQRCVPKSLKVSKS